MIEGERRGDMEGWKEVYLMSEFKPLHVNLSMITPTTYFQMAFSFQVKKFLILRGLIVEYGIFHYI